MTSDRTTGGRSDQAGSRSRRHRRARGSRGAALVEFAIISPLLFLLIFGIIEFGWIFYQKLDVRHGARETARLAAVNFNPDDEANGDDQASDIIVEGCDRMDESSNATVELDLPSGDQLGDRALVTVDKDLDSLTGFLDAFLPDDTSDTVAIRLEQSATWNARTQTC
ncbi:MAG: TadE/TadG family type IV pilus assembly protein [Acidimicrobiales bacterium]